MGNFKAGENSTPVADRSSKWYDPEWLPHTNVPNYPWHVKGVGYILSNDLVLALVQMTFDRLHLLWEGTNVRPQEDVMLGVLLLGFNTVRVQLPVSIEPSCKPGEDIVIDHYVTPKMMLSRWALYEEYGDPCHVPTSVRKSQSNLKSDNAIREPSSTTSTKATTTTRFDHHHYVKKWGSGWPGQHSREQTTAERGKAEPKHIRTNQKRARHTQDTSKRNRIWR